MPKYIETLGGETIRIIAPAPGELDRDAWAEFAQRRTFGFDTETTAIEKGKTPGTGRGVWYPEFRIRLAQFAARSDDGGVEAWVLRMDDPAQETAARGLLTDERAGFISHTGYDTIAAWRHFGLDIADRSLDTRVLARLAQKREIKGRAAESFALKGLVARHLSAELPDAAAELQAQFAQMAAAAGVTGRAEIARHGWDHIDAGHPVYARYAGLDAAAELLLAPVLIREAGQPDHVLAAEQRLAAMCARQMIAGLRIDENLMEERRVQLTAELEPLRARHSEVSGLGITQTAITVLPWLEDHGFDASRAPRTKTGGVSLDKRALPEILADPEQHLDSAAREVLELRRDASAVRSDLGTITQWAASMDPDGRIHPTIHSLGTATGRVSTSSPNVQNVSPRLRPIIIPPDGHGFAAIDLDQVELRFAHAHAAEREAIATVREGGDLHNLTAARAGVERKVAKTLNFQCLYGSGGQGISTASGMTWAAADVAVKGFWSGYPRLTGLRDRTNSGSGRVQLVSGRRTPAPWSHMKGEPLQPKPYARLNYFIQGSCRDLLMAAWLRLEDEFGYGRFVALSIHDEWLICAPVEVLPDVMAAARECLSFEYLHQMPISAEPDELIAEDGAYRWMKGETAQEIAAAREMREAA